MPLTWNKACKKLNIQAWITSHPILFHWHCNRAISLTVLYCNTDEKSNHIQGEKWTLLPLIKLVKVKTRWKVPVLGTEVRLGPGCWEWLLPPVPPPVSAASYWFSNAHNSPNMASRSTSCESENKSSLSITCTYLYSLFTHSLHVVQSFLRS